MAAADDIATPSSLLNTPTWAIACTCAVFILISLIAERTIFAIGRLATNYNKAALLEAFEKIKEELLMVGFISIALTLGPSWFTKICVPEKWSTVMLLCDEGEATAEAAAPAAQGVAAIVIHRQLAAATTDAVSCKEGRVPFMSVEGIHQLHIFMFILALVHIVYTLLIVILGMWIVRYWKVWEERATTKELLSAHGGARIVRETSFVRTRATSKWTTNPLLAYVVAFFQQFYSTVTETDYLTLRYGFVKSHLAENASFNFHNYIQRTFQEDFKHVVGISPGLWAYTVFWLLINVNGWETHILVTLIPIILVLIVGTKMQRIIMKLANQISDQHAVVVGMPLVKPNDDLFWFGRPQFILRCLHFILFQNALEMSFDIWAAVSFPSHNCLYGHPTSLVRRLIIGMVVQLFTGVITLPIYALVSQMGSNVKKTIFEEHIQLALKRWHKRAKESVQKDDENSRSAHAVHSTGPQSPGEDSILPEIETVVHKV